MDDLSQVAEINPQNNYNIFDKKYKVENDDKSEKELY